MFDSQANNYSETLHDSSIYDLLSRSRNEACLKSVYCQELIIDSAHKLDQIGIKFNKLNLTNCYGNLSNTKKTLLKTASFTYTKKNSVRFADSMGFNLVTLIPEKETPPISKENSKTNLAQISNEESTNSSDTNKSNTSNQSNSFVIENLCFTWKAELSFQNPVVRPEFYTNLVNNKVSLECIDAQNGILGGKVRVSNLGFQKKVFIRYTFDDWATQQDVNCLYLDGGNGTSTDTFSFSIIPNKKCVLSAIDSLNKSSSTNLQPTLKLNFAVGYEVNDKQYWDNNNGRNYVYDCLFKII